jgi:hypothetical protein
MPSHMIAAILARDAVRRHISEPRRERRLRRLPR